MHLRCALRLFSARVFAGSFLATLLVIGVCLSSSHTLAADDGNWPRWRGPNGDGTSPAVGLPVEWNEAEEASDESKPAENIVWKCELPAWGRSTPVIFGDAIFLTSHVDDEKLVLVKIDKQTGKITWTRQVGTASCKRMPLRSKHGDERRRMKFHTSHNMASPSPVTDGEVVIAHFGNGDLAAYDFDGNRLWHRNLQEDHGEFTIWWGRANSPALFGDLVISIVLQDACQSLSGDISPSYVVAHDKRTGKLVWRTMRPTQAKREFGDSYTTPIFWKRDGRTEMVVMGGEILDAYDPATGMRLWHLPALLGNRPVSGPVAVGEMIIVARGMKGPLVAFKPAGDGLRSHDEIVWQHEKGTPDSPWPVVWNDLLFVVTDNGIAKCLDAATGALKWKKRLGGGAFRASPLAAEGRVYFFNCKGQATVVEASEELKVLSKNRLNDKTFATPITSENRLYVRGQKWLYCLGE